MPDFVYRGLPIIKDGIVVAVQKVRGIKAEDGKTYHGEKDVDIRGNEFVYNRVPNTYTPTPIIYGRLLDVNGVHLFDINGVRLMVRGKS